MKNVKIIIHRIKKMRIQKKKKNNYLSSYLVKRLIACQRLVELMESTKNRFIFSSFYNIKSRFIQEIK